MTKPADSGSWAEIANNLCEHFDTAATFDLFATWNAEGSRSMAIVIRRMAKLLDEEVKARSDADSRERARTVGGRVKAKTDFPPPRAGTAARRDTRG